MATRYISAYDGLYDPTPVPAGDIWYETPGTVYQGQLYYRFKVGTTPSVPYRLLPYAPNAAPSGAIPSAPTGGGDVTGPTLSIDGYIPLWQGTTGRRLTGGIPTSTFATAAQGATADSALQPGDLLTSLSSGPALVGYIPVADGAGNINWNMLPAPVGGITQLTGDGTAGPGTGSVPLTLASVNGTPGVFGSATQGPVITVNAKGLITNVVMTTITPAVGSITGLGAGVAAFLATPSSANLAAAVTDETGTGALVFATSPTLVTPNLGTPSALVGTNITGTALGLTAGTVVTNANLTGPVTSIGNATSIDIGQTVQMEPYLAGTQTNSTTTLAVAADTEIDLSSTGTWVISYNISYTAALTTTGALFTVNTAGVLAVSNISGSCLYNTQTGDADNSLIAVFTGGLPVASSRVATPSINGAIITCTVVVTTPGPVQLEWRSEVGGSAIAITNVTGFAVKTGF